MIKIIEDVIPKLYQQKIEQVVFSQRTTWMYDESTIIHNHPKDTSQFVHMICVDDEVVSSELYNLLLPMILTVQEAFNLDFKEYSRIKSNLLIKKSNQPHIHPHHNDVDTDDCISLLYYVHDTDGDTYFYNKKFEGSYDYFENGGLEIVKKVSPKRGKVVIFNSNIYHSSSLPTKHEARAVINAVFKVKNDS